jgi:hypothetical protein
MRDANLDEYLAASSCVDIDCLGIFREWGRERGIEEKMRNPSTVSEIEREFPNSGFRRVFEILSTHGGRRSLGSSISRPPSIHIFTPALHLTQADSNTASLKICCDHEGLELLGGGAVPTRE